MAARKIQRFFIGLPDPGIAMLEGSVRRSSWACHQLHRERPELHRTGNGKRYPACVNLATSAFGTGAATPDTRAERVPLRRSELWLILAFWAFLIVLTAANALLDPRGRGQLPIPPSVPLTIAFAECAMWAVVTPILFTVVGRFTLERSTWLPRVALLLGVGVLVSIVVDVLTGLLRFELLFATRFAADIEPVVRVRRLWFINEFIIYIAILAAGFARVYFVRYQSRREETMRLQAQAAQLKAQLADARLAALRTQLNPHFLFNTLHAVSALVERDPRGVRRMIARLSELLRGTLEGEQGQEIPLSQELAFVERYMEIMRIRFQGRLEVETEIDPQVLDALVPNLILQPLVENALKHGVDKIDGPGVVRIEARREADRTVLSVRDNGPMARAPDKLGEGVGLRNTRMRLAQLYGNLQSLTLQPLAAGGLVAQVSLPYRTRADLHATAVDAAT
jgi:two-component sensor histidine kinase